MEDGRRGNGKAICGERDEAINPRVGGIGWVEGLKRVDARAAQEAACRSQVIAIVDRGIDLRMEAGVDGACVADGLKAGTKLCRDGCGKMDDHRELGDAARGGGLAHVLLHGGGHASEIEIVTLGPHADGGEDARGKARGDKVRRGVGAGITADIFGGVRAELEAFGVGEIALFVAGISDLDDDHVG
jgi:hypothetical protein